ncbi:DUF6266 family protein [Halosquirtibacter xylanolyticus]|uniref:DUF6266 family protein n=1 Tax=Halosquirtibacter xylanolyticus TaxID=3374599 RepID=UPI00374A15B5|nr:DUF6266 family protein [Prolixibacteraceae bacterium]
MARMKGNLISGLVGNVVLYHRNNVQMVRSRPDCSSRTATPKQLEQRKRMVLCNAFLCCFKEVIRISYRRGVRIGQAFNQARSHVIKEAIFGEYPALYVDYSKVRMSKELKSQMVLGDVVYDGVHLKIDVNVTHRFLRKGYLVVLRYGIDSGDCSTMQKLRCRAKGVFEGMQSYCFSWAQPVEGKEVSFWAMVYDPVKNVFYGSVYFSCMVGPWKQS